MTDVRGARAVRMLNDPALGGDLLLVGLVLAARIDLGLTRSIDVATAAFPGDPLARFRVERVFETDVRTYRPLSTSAVGCQAPVARRGGVCGRSWRWAQYLTDWSTGERLPHAACDRHMDWYGQHARAHEARRPAEVPMPLANRGGVLRAHLPEYDWPTFWRSLDPAWVAYPESRAWPKPTLSLVLGDGEGGRRAGRPLLVATRGGAP